MFVDRNKLRFIRTVYLKPKIIHARIPSSFSPLSIDINPFFFNEMDPDIIEQGSFSVTIWQKSGKSEKSARFRVKKTDFWVWLKCCR